MNQAEDDRPYANLGPEQILDILEQAGWQPDGSLLALNSYENRVYQLTQWDGSRIVAKFYRPGRWPDAAIIEEHQFACQLAELEIPVIAPMAHQDGQTLFSAGGYRVSVSLCRGGRSPELDDPDALEWIGRFMGRIHALGRTNTFAHRPTIGPEYLGHQARSGLLASQFLPAQFESDYAELSQQIISAAEAAWQRAGDTPMIRLHGDCHPSNILWTEAGPHFVDLDDCANGPAIQDLWMLISGDRADMSWQLSELIAGYEDFCDFDRRQLHLLEPLRALRQLHYCTWLAKRWNDPAFPSAFPWFNTEHYWQQFIANLREQIMLLEQPPLVV